MGRAKDCYEASVASHIAAFGVLTDTKSSMLFCKH